MISSTAFKDCEHEACEKFEFEFDLEMLPCDTAFVTQLVLISMGAVLQRAPAGPTSCSMRCD